MNPKSFQENSRLELKASIQGKMQVLQTHENDQAEEQDRPACQLRMANLPGLAKGKHDSQTKMIIINGKLLENRPVLKLPVRKI